MLKRTISLILALVMVAGMMPVRTYAQEAEIPETTVPETTAPEATVPETTVPETTVPEMTIPEPAVPEETTPGGVGNITMVQLEGTGQTGATLLAYVSASGTCGDNLTWEYYSDGRLVISGTGAMTDFGRYDAMPWYSRRNSATTVELPEGLTHIGSYAFHNFTKLSGDLAIPESVESIGASAFTGCSNLNLSYSGTVKKWMSINEGVFKASCTDGTVYTWGACGDDLRYTIVDSKLTVTGTGAMGEYTATGSVPWHTYASQITTVELPEGLTAVGNYTFWNFEGLTSVTIPEGVRSLGDGCFANANYLEVVNLPNSLESIGKSAFESCKAMSSLYIPASVTVVGECAFDYCNNLPLTYGGTTEEWAAASETIYPAACSDGTIYSWGSCGENLTYRLIDGCLTITGTGTMTDFSSGVLAPWCYNNNADKITKVVLPEGLTHIGSYAFAYCGNLTQIEIPDTVASLGSYSFNYCSKLPALTIPEGVEALPDGMFYECEALAELVLPETLTTIGQRVFAYCDTLKEVTIPGSVTTIGQQPFYGCSDTTVTYTGTVEQWKAANVTARQAVCTDGTVYSWGTAGDELTYTVVDDRIVFTGTGAMYDYSYYSNVPWYGYRSQVTTVELPEGLTTIGQNAFNGYANLTGILNIPASITSVGQYAFSSASKLTITYEGTVEAWMGVSVSSRAAVCTDGTVYAWGSCGENLSYAVVDEKLIITGTGAMADYTSFNQMPWYSYKPQISKLVLPEGLTHIGGFAFHGMTALKQVTIPTTVTSIGDNAFYNCEGLTVVALPDSVTSLGSYVFDSCDNLNRVILPRNLTQIPDYAFTDCVSLSGITIPSGVKRIGSRAFFGCPSLNTIQLPEGMESLGDYVFYNCSNLADINIPASLTTIGESTFQNTGILAMTIPTTVTSVGKSALKGDVTYEGTMEQWMTVSQFGRTAVCSDGKILHWGDCGDNLSFTLKEDGVLNITGSGDFTIWTYGSAVPWYNFRSNIVAVNLPEGLTSIGAYAFYYFDKLQQITIPSTVTSIGNNAFQYCRSLTTVSIPGSVADIGNNAFANCSGLKTIHFLGNPPAMVSTAFSSVTAEANFPEDAGWTAADFQNYGGTLTWKQVCAAHEPEADDRVEPTCTETGLTEGSHCAVCGAVLVPQQVIPATGHTEVIDPAVDASCEEFGLTEGSHCAVCGEILVAQKVIPSHTFNGTVCIYCGIIGGSCGEDAYWQFDTTSGTLTISGRGDMADLSDSLGQPWSAYTSQIRHIVVRKGITSIGNMSFYNHTALLTAELPEDLTAIGSSAFYGCARLNRVDLPDTLTYIGSSAFSFCERLKSLQLPDSLTYLGSYAFRDCFALTSVVIPAGITRIEYDTFYNCTGLETVILPDTLEYIGSEAFYKCKSLKKIVIPATVEYIQNYAFQYCESLTDIQFCHTPEDSLTIYGYSFSINSNMETVDTIVRVPYTNDIHPAISGYAWAGGYRNVTYKGTVPVPAQKILVTAQDNVAQIQAGLPLTFFATPTPAHTTSEMIWTVIGEPGDALVSADGVVTGLVPGYVTVRCESSDDPSVYGECRLKILKPTADVSSISIRCEGEFPAEAEVGTQVQMIADVQPGNAANKQVTWEVIDGTGKATIDENGMLTTIEVGTVTVYATSTDGTEVIGSAGIHIVRYAEDITIRMNGDPTRDSMGIGERMVLTADVLPDDATNTSVTWTVSNGTGGAKLHTYSNYAVLEGTDAGTVTVTVTSKDSRSVSVSRELTVNEIVTYGANGGNLYFDPATGIIVDADDTITSANIPAKIGGVQVTGIGAYAFAKVNSSMSFYENTVLTSVTIPSSVTFIGDSAFRSCTTMTALKISGTNLKSIGTQAFYGCRSLATLNLPESVTHLGDNALYGMQGLKHLTISGEMDLTGIYDNWGALETLTLTGSYVCSQHHEIHDGGYSSSVMEGRNAKKIILSDTIRELKTFAFTGSDMQELVIQSDTIAIGDYALESCDKLTTVTVDGVITEIGKRAFAWCRSLTALDLSEGLVSIGERAFNECYSLTDMTLPRSLKTVGQYAFEGTQKLNLLNMDAIPERIMAKETPLKGLVVVPQALIQATGGRVSLEYTFESRDEFERPWDIAGLHWFSNDQAPTLVAYSSGTIRLRCWDIYTGAQGIKEIRFETGVEIRGADAGYLLSGKTMKLSAWQMPENKPADVFWYLDSSDAAYASIDHSGKLTAKAVPYAVQVTVYAEPYGGGDQASVKLWILPAGTGLHIYQSGSDSVLDGQTLELDMHDIQTLSLTAVMSGNQNVGTIRWSSSAATVASVNDQGMVTLLRPGTVTITAQGAYGEKATVKLQIQYLNTAKTLTAEVDAPEIGLQSGDTARIRVYGTELLDPATLRFSIPVTQEKMATVDAEGVITAGEVPGTVTVTAAIKDDPLERTVSVKVKIITRQTDLLRLRPDAQEPGQILWLDAQGNVTNPEDSLTGRVILRHDAVSTGTYTFTISPEAFDNAGNNLPLTAGSLKWASSDTKIAGITSVAADGTATVTVRSGSVGSCVITAVTTDAAKIETAVTIHVRDYSPRLESASLTANALTCAPVTTGLVESYGNTIQAVTLYEYDAQEKAYSTEPSRRLKATWDANVLSITPAETIANGTVKLLLEVGCGDGLKYQFPISLKVKNTTPSITAKQTGKLNLFYGDSEATFTVSVKDSTVLGVTVDETSTDSFQVNGFDPATGTVTLGFTKDYRSGGKPDTSIQLLLTLEGYNQPVGKKVTISTTTVRPKLAVTPSASVINTALSGDPTTLIRVYDKTTGENLALTDGDVEITATFATSVVVDGGVQLTLDAGKGGTATILVQQDNWREAVKLTHKISVQTKLPTPKPAATTLKLNSVFSWQTAQTVLTLDQANLTIASVDFEPTVEAGAMIDLTYEDGIITAEFVDTDALPKAGTYTYRYTVKLADGTELAAKTLKVTVAATVPKVKLASTTLKLNRFLTGEETAQTTVSVGTAGYTLAGFAELDDWSDENVKLLFDPDTGALCAELLNPDAANKKHTFQLTPILLHEATGQQAPLPAKVKLGVQIYNNTSLSVSLSTKGKLDLMDPDSRITYTVSSISNAAGRIEDVTLTGDDADLFDITCDLDAAKPVIQLKMVDGAEYATNVTYKVQLSFLLCGQDVQSKILSIRVSQSKLKLAANPKTWLYYQSQTTPLAGAVTLTAPEGAMLTEEGITLNRSKTTAALLEALGDNDISVKISEDGKTAHISGVIVDAGHLIAGKSYSLYLDILPLNNAVNTKATTLKVTVKVQK